MYVDLLCKSRERIELRKAQEDYEKRLTAYVGRDKIIKEWDESQHPRDENGKFTSTGGSTARDELNSRISSGKISTKIDTKKQNKHIEGTKRYEKAINDGEHPSRLTISKKQQQALVDKYTKEGDVKIFKNGSIRVEFTHNKNIGVCCSKDGSVEQKTNKGTIHYSKTGTHIVPDIP